MSHQLEVCGRRYLRCASAEMHRHSCKRPFMALQRLLLFALGGGVVYASSSAILSLSASYARRVCFLVFFVVKV